MKLHQYLAFLVQRCVPAPRACHVTCDGKRDGIGAQAQAIISTMLYAHDMGIGYVHTPFSSIAHNVHGDPGWERRWEEFFALGEGETQVGESAVRSLEIIDAGRAERIRRRPSALFVVEHCHSYADLFAKGYANIAVRLREKYRSSPKSAYQLHAEPGKLNIAVHIRRGDVSVMHPKRFTGTDRVAATLKRVRAALAGSGIRTAIHLYSQGSEQDFADLDEFGMVYHLDRCVFETMHNLVSCDVLIMSKSSFSYTAALLSEGVKLYEPFKHRPLADWLVLDGHGGFDAAAFAERVRRLGNGLGKRDSLVG